MHQTVDDAAFFIESNDNRIEYEIGEECIMLNLQLVPL